MDCNASLDFQNIFLTDDESIDSPIEIMKQLQLDQRLPEGRKTCEQLLKSLELQPKPKDQEKIIHNQFVFHGQCLVLGDSEVGKTSLVKSLTGKSFDPRQPKTEGIDECLVDQKWKNLSMKDFIFGIFSQFCERLVAQLTLFAPGNATNILFHETRADCGPDFVYMILLLLGIVMTVLNSNICDSSLCFAILLEEIVKLCACGGHSEINFRYTCILALFAFSYSGPILIGVLLALVSFHTSITSVVTIEGYVCMAVGSVLLFAALFLVTKSNWSLGIRRQCPYPGQITFTNHKFVGMICFSRLLFTILVGFSSCWMLTHICILSPEITGKSIKALTNCLLLLLLIEWIPRLIESKPGPNTVILILTVTKLASALLNSPSSYFVIIFPLFFFDTLYREWFRAVLFGNIHRNHGGCKSFTAVVIMRAVLNNNALKQALDKKFSSLTLRILDFAGDKEYYAYHHMFLRRQAFYIIVFNMAEFAEGDFAHIDEKCKRLQFWFESVCSHVPPKNNTPIFLVGTHRGNMDKNSMDIVDGHLRKYLWNAYCDELIINDVEELMFFPVENSKGNKDTGVQVLQKKITSVADECKGIIGCDIPVSWIRIQDAIISLKEKKEAKFCVTLGDFPRVFDNFVCTNWSKKTLKYFHDKGMIIYLDRKQDLHLCDWVLLKPEILVDIFIQLVIPSPANTQERGLRCDWNLLQSKGMLTKSLLRSIISKVQENEEAMTAFLEEYDLICPLANKKVQTCNLSDEQPTHFVPSLLPMSTESDTLVWHGNDTDKKCYVFFTRFLPEPLFHGLLSRAHKLSKLEFPNGQTVLFRDAGKFWMSAWQPYCLKLMKEEKMIEVTFSCSNNRGMRPSDVLCQVFSMVDGICRRDFPFVKFYCGPACPSHKCPGHQPDYLLYSAGEEQVPRLHVYNVMPGRQGNRIAYLYCENHSFEEELTEWVP